VEQNSGRNMPNLMLRGCEEVMAGARELSDADRGVRTGCSCGWPRRIDVLAVHSRPPTCGDSVS
jgi:hypothetical protein